MNTRIQIKVLLLCCFLLLVGLVTIQYYLIQNTYDLQKKEYVKDVKDSIESVVDAKELDVLEDSLSELIKRLELLKLKDSISRTTFDDLLKQKTDSIRKLGNLFIASQEEYYPILKEIKLRYQYSEIIFTKDSITDTILKAIQPPLIFIGHQLGESSFQLRYSNSFTNNDWDNNKDDVQTQESYQFRRQGTVDVDITNWKQKVWGRMAWMLLGAVVLLLAVIGLFFWMYRMMIKQKKIAEVKTDFANNITHELKTPLASMSLIVKSMSNEKIRHDTLAMNELLQSLERQNNRIQTIVDRVLESSIDKPALYLEEIEIVAFLKNLLMDYRTGSQGVITDIQPTELYLTTDAYKLERVILNLLDNAYKFGGESSRIYFKSFAKGNQFFIEISDEGEGIPLNEQKKVFDKFYRISKGNEHSTKGLGLGLYLCMQMMSNLGGSIQLQSKPDNGSTFTLILPLR